MGFREFFQKLFSVGTGFSELFELEDRSLSYKASDGIVRIIGILIIGFVCLLKGTLAHGQTEIISPTLKPTEVATLNTK